MNKSDRPRLDQIEWLAPIFPKPAQRALDPDIEAVAKQVYGQIPPYVWALAQCPWVARMQMGVVWPRLAHIPYRLADLVFLVVCQDNSCRYCYGSARAFLRLSGHSEAKIRQLETDSRQADLSEGDRLALDFARLVSRASPRAGGAEATALAAHGFSPGAIVEIATYAALNVLATRGMTCLAAAPEPFEKLAGHWYSPLMRPLVALMMRKRRRPVAPEPLPPEAVSGPMGSLFARLDGVPMAGILHRAVNEALASEVLPRRTKLLLIAVVARALECAMCEGGARSILASDGFSPDELEEVLQRLHGKSLTPLEAKLIPFARETVRYDTGQIQRRMRELSAAVPETVFIEFVGVIALANALARLTIVLDCP